MAVEFGAIGALTQGVARLLGLSKTARLRRAINDHLKLYERFKGHDDLSKAASQLAELIEFQVSQLVGREAVAAHRVYEWSNLAVGIFLAGLFAIPLPWLIPPDEIWQWLVLIVLLFFIILFLAVGASMVRKQPKLEELIAASEDVGVRDMPRASEADSPPSARSHISE